MAHTEATAAAIKKPLSAVLTFSRISASFFWSMAHYFSWEAQKELPYANAATQS